MKRILALDGGGIRGVFTLEILLKIEELLREHLRQQDPAKAEKFVLRDHFDFFAGTSTGAIIATCLCWGMKVEKVLEIYMEYGQKMFQPVPWYRPYKKYLISKFESGPLSKVLQGIFIEDGEAGAAGQQAAEETAERNGRRQAFAGGGAQPQHGIGVAVDEQSVMRSSTTKAAPTAI